MATKHKQFSDEVKSLISDPHKRVAHHDLAMQKVDELIIETASETLPVDTEVTPEEIETRLKYYESVVEELETLIVLTAYWGNQDHHLALQKILTRLSESGPPDRSGNYWLGLRWYPLARAMYAGGIAAIAGGQYRNLLALMTGWTGYDDMGDSIIAVARLKKSFLHLHDPFKLLPDLKNHRLPINDYFFSSMRPIMKRLLWIESQYDLIFDRFELVTAMIHKDFLQRQSTFLGRFVCYDPLVVKNPLVNLSKESLITQQLLDAGLFGGSIDQFNAVVESVSQETQQLGWYF